MHKHHFIWLRKYPHRTETWLQEKLDDGFHIHHQDGNHANNASRNLILIEGNDHLELHGRPVCWKDTLREGRARAKAAGVKFGRKTKLSALQQKEARSRRDAGETLKSMANSYGVSVATICRLCRRRHLSGHPKS